jgi:hypothetical protein
MNEEALISFVASVAAILVFHAHKSTALTVGDMRRK